jgi:hypothetical protein
MGIGAALAMALKLLFLTTGPTRVLRAVGSQSKQLMLRTMLMLSGNGLKHY